MAAMLAYGDALIEALIREADQVKDVTILDLTRWIVGAETPGDAFHMAMEFDADELADLAHACDVDASGDRAAVAYRVTVAGRGLDEDEAADLRRWLDGHLPARRRATRTLLQHAGARV